MIQIQSEILLEGFKAPRPTTHYPLPVPLRLPLALAIPLLSADWFLQPVSQPDLAGSRL